MTIISKYGNELYLILCSLGFLPATAAMITAQAAHETANFTSYIFMFNNNPFGMKLPKQRRTTATGEARGHAVYDSMESAAQDYLFYFRAQKYPLLFKDIDTFVNALNIHGYFEDSLDNYKKGVNNFHKLYFG